MATKQKAISNRCILSTRKKNRAEIKIEFKAKVWYQFWSMFDFGQIWAFPTDTSFGLGVRADDVSGLGNLAALKK